MNLGRPQGHFNHIDILGRPQGKFNQIDIKGQPEGQRAILIDKLEHLFKVTFFVGAPPSGAKTVVGIEKRFFVSDSQPNFNQ